jgi:hypothetical protein
VNPPEKPIVTIFSLPNGARLLVRAGSAEEAQRIAREWLAERKREEDDA